MFWSFHGCNFSNCVLFWGLTLCRRIPAFQLNMLPWSSGLKCVGRRNAFHVHRSYWPWPGFISPRPPVGSESASSLQPAYINRPAPQPTHFNHEDWGIVFLRNFGILQQDFTLSQRMRPQSESYNLYGFMCSFRTLHKIRKHDITEEAGLAITI